jgi:hypothetical protein
LHQNHINELSVILGGSWSNTDLTLIPSAPAQAIPLAGFAFEAQPSKQVVSRTMDGHIHELSLILGGSWSHADLTQITGAPPATFIGAGFALETQRSKQVIYVWPDGHIHELSVILGGSWSDADLTAITGAPLPRRYPSGRDPVELVTRDSRLGEIRPPAITARDDERWAHRCS